MSQACNTSQVCGHWCNLRWASWHGKWHYYTCDVKYHEWCSLWKVRGLYTRAWGPVMNEILSLSDLVENVETIPLHYYKVHCYMHLGPPWVLTLNTILHVWHHTNKMQVVTLKKNQLIKKTMVAIWLNKESYTFLVFGIDLWQFSCINEAMYLWTQANCTY